METEPQPRRKGTWQLIVSVVALLLLSFEVSFGTGQLSVDRTQDTSFLDWLWFVMAISWVFKAYRKHASRRVAIWALAVVVPVLALTAVASFRAGRSDRYPDEARRLVETLRIHAREVKRIKAELSDVRPRFSKPEDLLTIEPSVSALSGHIKEIDTLTQQIEHYQVPTDIAQILKLLRQALPTEKRQIANIESQIAVVRSAHGMSAQEKELVYRQQLLPLTQEEEEIERERQDANLEEKIKQVPQQPPSK